MPVFDARDLLSFPQGNNATDTVLGGIHFNKTILEDWNYTLYSNGTLSNNSWCMLVFEPYAPKLLFPNGTFINATWCYTPLNPIGPRAKIGLGFAVAFGLSIVGTLISLRKHGSIYLPVEKRFWPIGRRWQWYWALFVAAAALISLITNIDVDRYYVQELPIVLSAFFWFLMQMGIMAVVWEAVRHWGSWMERQFIDPNPFALRDDDRRAKFEFWLPLFFYFWLWLHFFLIVPRNWGQIELQRSPDQTLQQAVPTATDGRFKAASFCLFICWVTIVTSLRHSIKHYQPRNRGLFNRAVGLIRHCPIRFLLLVPLCLAVPAYQVLCAWEFEWSVLNVHGDNLAIFLGGYAPSLLITLVQIAAGFLNPNEDKELLRQRRQRGDEVDRELGIVRKPAWWRRVNADYIHGAPGERMRDRIARNVRELGGGRATARNIDRAIETRAREAEAGNAAGPRAAAGDAVEMGSMRRTTSNTASSANGGNPSPSTTAGGGFDAARPSATVYAGKSDRRRSERTTHAAAGLLFPNGVPGTGASMDRRADLMADGPPPYAEQHHHQRQQQRGRSREQSGVSSTLPPPTAERSNSTETSASITAPPQQVRSMLDV